MKKITTFIERPFVTTFLCVVGLTGGFLLGIAGKNLVDLQTTWNKKKEYCKEAYGTLCVQVHACTGNSVNDCDRLVEEEQMCNIDLPDIQAIYRCKEELRNLECEDDMPTSCSLFME